MNTWEDWGNYFAFHEILWNSLLQVQNFNIRLTVVFFYKFLEKLVSHPTVSKILTSYKKGETLLASK
jgi:hypothetical protein